MTTPQPSNNWLNEAGIIDPHMYNFARSEHAECCSVARRIVRQAKTRLRAAKTPEAKARARESLKEALKNLLSLEYGPMEVHIRNDVKTITK